MLLAHPPADMLPLALRVALLVSLGSVSAATGARSLRTVSTDLLAAAGAGSPDGSSALAHEATLFTLARRTAVVTAIGAVASLTFANMPMIQDAIAMLTLFLILVVLFKHPLARQVAWRVARGGLSIDHRLGDILLADTLVSYSSVLIDLTWSLYCLVALAPSSQQTRSMMPSFVVLAACIPAGIRIRQCWTDFRRTRKRQHLANLGKYIIGNIPFSLRFQMLQLAGTAEAEQHARVLPYALATSAAYSLYWDIVIDWGALKVGKSGSPARFSKLHYVTATLFDSLARFAWLLAKPDERVVFVLQALEIARRAVWVPLRVDSEPRGSETFALPTLERPHLA